MNSNLSLERWNLPKVVIDAYSKKGLKNTFPWQAECLSLDRVLDGRNLVYAAPTSAGKTLVAEILMLKRVLETGKKVLVILPFISLAREKLFSLRELFEEAGVRVDGYMGGYAPTNGFTSIDIAVCTIEKANGLINKLIEEKNISQIGMLVVDELHMVGDEGRGYIIELLLTKIRFMSLDTVDSQESLCKIQIVGMSATLPNLDLLANWLDAALYVTGFRPVPLQRCLKVGNIVYDESLTKIRDFTPPFKCKGDDDNIPGLCYETLTEGHSVLIFCPTKNWCEKLAKNIAHQFYDLNNEHQKNESLPFVKLDLDGLKEIYSQLTRCPVGVDAILNVTLPLGVAYHHAGLTTEERDIVEAGFRTGAIRVLVATSTLSSGVNLPARRVIIRTPMFNRKVLDVRTYLQMTGRAGRKGVDSKGESILVCRPTEQSRGKSLLTSKPLPVQSCLINAKNEELTVSMKRAILEIIVNGIASTYSSVMDYTNCTLLSAQLRSNMEQTIKGPLTRRRLSSVSPVRRNNGLNEDVIKSCIQWLKEHEFIYLQDDEALKGGSDQMSRQKIVATQLGRAALLSSLPTSDALTVLADLHQAMKALALDTELHLIYLVTPIFCYNDWTGLDWYQYLDVFENLPNSHKNAANLIGVTNQFLVTMASGASIPKKGKHAEKVERLLGTHRRFYAALALHDLVQEVPLSKVCEKYSCNRGMLQQLQQSAASFAGMVTTFCEELGWWSLEVLLKEFQTRLAFGVQRELMDLMQISLLNSQRARALHSAGITSCNILSGTSPSQIELILRNSSQFLSERKASNESQWEVEERRRQRNIHITGHKGLTEYEVAEMMIRESKRICGVVENKRLDISPSARTCDTVNSSLCVEDSSLSGPKRVAKKGCFDQSTQVKTPRYLPKSPKDEYSAKTSIGGTNRDCLDTTQLDIQTDNCSQSVVRKRTSKMFMPQNHTVNDSKISDTSLEKELDNLISDVCESQFGTKADNAGSKFNCDKLENSDMELLNACNEANFSCRKSSSSNNGEHSDIDVAPDCSEQTDIFVLSDRCDESENDCSEISSDIGVQPITLHLPSDLDDSSDELSLPEPTFPFSTKAYNSIPQKCVQLSDDDICIADEPKLAETSVKNEPIEGSDGQMVHEVNTKATKFSLEVEDSKQNSAVTSLSDSQLCAVFDSSDFQSIENQPKTVSTKARESQTLQNEVKNSVGHKDQVNSFCGLSPGCMAAMDVTFSPYVEQGSHAIKTSIFSTNLTVKVQVSTPKELRSFRPSFPITKEEKMFGDRDIIEHEPNYIQELNTDVCMPINTESTHALTDNSLEDLFECTSGLLTESNFTPKSAKISTLADRTFKLNSDHAPQGLDFTNCATNDRLSLLCTTKVSENSSPSFWDKNFEFPEAVSPTQQCSELEDDHLILSSQKDTKKFVKTCRIKKAKARKPILCDKNNLIELPPVVNDKNSVVPIPACVESNVEDSSFCHDVLSNSVDCEDTCATQSSEDIQSQRGLNIIDVCSHRELFDTFLQEWSTKRIFSVAIATRKEMIGKSKSSMSSTNGESSLATDGCSQISKMKGFRILGIAVCWGKQDAFYISLEKEMTMEQSLYTEKHKFVELAPPPIAKALDLDSRKKKLRSSICPLLKKNSIVVSIDAKTQMKVLRKVVVPNAVFLRDPAVAAWLLDPSADPQTLSALVRNFIPEKLYFLKDIGLDKWDKLGSISCNAENNEYVPSRVRACAEAACSYHLMSKLKTELVDVDMWGVYTGVEMPHISSLISMEINGIGFDKEKCQIKVSDLHAIARDLEKEAYIHAKKMFNLGSPIEVAKVLYGDLGLPASFEEQSVDARLAKPGYWRKGLKKRKKGSWSTKKEVLEKLKALHPLPGIILNWRQISFTLSNSLHPLSRVAMPSRDLEMFRVHPECITHSVTGRVSIAEPNVQNVPKSFEVRLRDGKTEAATNVNVRELFLPAKGCVFLTADYSQLEIRIFAHLSGDDKLLKILNMESGDVFKMIAAQWKSISIAAVTADDRQRAKQICYGMLYGIGAKALSQQLSIDERNAKQFMESFLQSFPSMKSYIRTVVKQCKEKGYVETLLGRRRYLPAIQDSNLSLRSQAERQAVNTTVQGSAADVIKTATIQIQKMMKKKYQIIASQRKQADNSNKQKSNDQICHLVLHLHDELIFEVQEEIVGEIASMVRSCMENVMKLKVKLPIRLSIGQSWGNLKDYHAPDV